jgi:uncharacterized protein YndB with AHSA1/START domain
MSILFETDLPAGPDVVFAHFTGPAPGGRYHLWWDRPGWHLPGEYLVVEEPTILTFTWEWDHDEAPPGRVDNAIEPREDGSHLTIWHESGSEDAGAGYLEGWKHLTG